MNNESSNFDDQLENRNRETDIEVHAASQWRLMWLRFKKNKASILAAMILFILYFLAIFAGFMSPYLPNKQNVNKVYAPPQKIHFIDEQGNFHLRPFVYGYEQELNLETMQREYTVNKNKKYPIYFFVRGQEYELWNLLETDLRFFGIGDGGNMFLLGTDELGRDMVSRIIYAARISLSIGLLGVFVSLILGLIFGSISGYYGGHIDNIIQRIIEILRSFPKLPLWMALSASLPPEWPQVRVYFAITIILSILGWTGLARVARGKVLSLKNEDFVLAARLSGTKEAKIMRKHLIPSFLSHIIAVVTLSIPGMILGETALSFLGIGLRPPTISWGVLLVKAQNVHTLSMAPWLLIPGLFVIITVLSFNFLGDGLRDAADPYQE